MRFRFGIILIVSMISCGESSNAGSSEGEKVPSSDVIDVHNETKVLYETGEVMLVQTHYKNEVIYETIYYKNGVKMNEGSMKNSKRHGTWVSYDSLGNMIMKWTTIEGVDQGLFEQYYPNGNIEIRGEDIRGDGLFEFYDSLGNLVMKNYYQNNWPIDTLFWNESK